MKTSALILDLISNAMLLVGLVWGGISLWSTRRRLRRERELIFQLRDEREADPNRNDRPDLRAEVEARGVPMSSWNDLLTLKQDLELAVIDYLRPTLSWPFLLAVSGAVLGVVVTILNLGS